MTCCTARGGGGGGPRGRARAGARRRAREGRRGGDRAGAGAARPERPEPERESGPSGRARARAQTTCAGDGDGDGPAAEAGERAGGGGGAARGPSQGAPLPPPAASPLLARTSLAPEASTRRLTPLWEATGEKFRRARVWLGGVSIGRRRAAPQGCGGGRSVRDSHSPCDLTSRGGVLLRCYFGRLAKAGWSGTASSLPFTCCLARGCYVAPSSLATSPFPTPGPTPSPRPEPRPDPTPPPRSPGPFPDPTRRPDPRPHAGAPSFSRLPNPCFPARRPTPRVPPPPAHAGPGPMRLLFVDRSQSQTGGGATGVRGWARALRVKGRERCSSGP